MGTKKEVRWMETPWDIELIRRAVQNGKLVASFGKRETIARKATREELLDVGGESWYVGYNDGGEMVPMALIINRRVEWYAAPLTSVQMPRFRAAYFALKRRLNLYAAFV